MPRKPSPQPNEVELKILGALWDRGPSTAREIHDALSDERQTRLSSTTKMLQVMVDKGLLARDETTHPLRFATAHSRERTERGIVGDMVSRAFGGAADRLILRAVESQFLSAEQLADIRRLIDQREGETT